MLSKPVEAKVGLLWAYLGPKPVPLVPDWDLYSEPGYKQIIFAPVPCNWFQCQENSIDPVHFEWLHSNIRDPETNQQLCLPRVERALRNQLAHGKTRAPRNQHLAGQPQVILDEMDRIWAERAQGQ